jgi:hypothetical protein
MNNHDIYNFSDNLNFLITTSRIIRVDINFNNILKIKFNPIYIIYLILRNEN